MLTTLVSLAIGFSVVSALLLGSFWFAYAAIEKTWLSTLSCCGLLAGLACLQLFHWQYLQGDSFALHSPVYKAVLFGVAPLFYLFSRELLQFRTRNTPLLLVHFLPLVLVPFVVSRFFVPVAFAVGTAYALRISYMVYALKNQREHFRLEFLTFASFALLALVILVLGLFSPWVGESAFVYTYALLIGCGLFAVSYLQLRFPNITLKTREAVIATYAGSTLRNIDCAPLVEKIKQLLGEQKLYRNENLSLGDIANELELSSHQTSELINTHFGCGFARLVRDYRIADAKEQLINEPKASVLSIGLSVGFNSQSNFYASFREITGQTPAQFRKSAGLAAAE